MNIAARITRLESREGVDNPLSELTDEELDCAVACLTARIERESGLTVAEFMQKEKAEHGILRGLDVLETRRMVAEIKAGRWPYELEAVHG